MKDRILELVKNYPKHYTKLIKKDRELSDWVEANSLVTGDLASKIYSAVYQQSDRCSNGKQKKFRSFSEGFAFCGRASECPCARESVSKQLSSYHKNLPESSRQEIQDRRLDTIKEKYGVDNIGKLDSAIKSRQQFLSDSARVSRAVAKNKETKLANHGESTFNNREQASRTFKERYTTEYWVNRFDNENITILHNRDQMQELFEEYNPYEISQRLGVHVQTVYKYLNQYGIRSPFQSSEEREVKDYLRDIGVSNIVENTRRLLPSGREIDIYLPDYKIAIEYNGVYWHHEDIAHINKDYHRDKFVECEKLGIQLITIFSTFWKNKPEIVKSILRNKLGIDQSKVYARSCQVNPIKNRDHRDLMNQHHIQGYVSSPISYGLFKDDALIAAMTFGKNRVAIGKPDAGYELVRFASSHRVVGGASKLLSAFIRDYAPDRIYSYSDNEWSTGNLYSTIGFQLEREIAPSYWYLDPNHKDLRHRYNYTKHKLVAKGYDSSLTEREIAKQIGLLKIWDCGKRKWVWQR